MTSTTSTATGSTPRTTPAITFSSFASSLAAILAQDTGGALVTQLQSFDAAVQTTPSVEGAVAAGEEFFNNTVMALPSVEGALIRDTTNLLVTDAVTEITKAQQALTTVSA